MEIGKKVVHRHDVGIARVDVAQMHGMQRGIEVAHRFGGNQCAKIALHRIDRGRPHAYACRATREHDRIDA